MKKYLILLTLNLISCAQPQPDSSWCGFQMNAYGQRLSWNLPIALHIHESYPTEALQPLYSAMNNWENATKRKLFILQGKYTGDNIFKYDGISVIYWYTNWERSINEQGVTRTYWDGSSINEADVIINDMWFNYAFTDSELNSNNVHLESLLVHELGHVLGLEHNVNINSVMFKGLSNGAIRVFPSVDDINNFTCEYTH